MNVLTPKHMEALTHLLEGWVGPDCDEAHLNEHGENGELLSFLVSHNYAVCFSRPAPASVATCVAPRRFIYVLTVDGAAMLEE